MAGTTANESRMALTGGYTVADLGDGDGIIEGTSTALTIIDSQAVLDEHKHPSRIVPTLQYV
jgi:hypothetical protein